MKYLLKYIKGYTKYIIFGQIFILFEAIVQITLPYLMSIIIDTAITKGISEVIKYGSIMIVLPIVSLILRGFFATKFVTMTGIGFARNLRKAVFDKIQELSFGNIDKFSVPSLITRSTLDIRNIQDAFLTFINLGSSSLVLGFSATAMAIMTAPKLSIIFAIAFPILILVVVVLITIGYEQFKISLKLNDNLNLVVQENLLNMRVVKSFVMENYEIKKFNNKANKLRKIQLFVERVIALAQPLIQLIINICIVPIIYYGSRFVFNGDMEIGKVSSFIVYTFTIVMQLVLICFMMVKIVMSLASIERIKEILLDEPEVKSGNKTDLLDNTIIYKDVNFSYAKDINKLVLRDINLEIKSGETIGIIGGTASGKTTLVHLLLRFYDVFSGEISIGGTNIKDYNLEFLMSKIAIVPQKNTLFSGTLKENILWGNKNATDEEIRLALKRAQASEFVDNLPNGLDCIIERDGNNFSGGQKQRLCIARALLKNAKILILDDSTSAVDTTTDFKIRKIFREELPDVTKIIISQRILSVEESDKIVIMDNGRINAIGKHKDLIKSNEIYKDINNSQKEK